MVSSEVVMTPAQLKLSGRHKLFFADFGQVRTAETHKVLGDFKGLKVGPGISEVDKRHGVGGGIVEDVLRTEMAVAVHNLWSKEVVFSSSCLLVSLFSTDAFLLFLRVFHFKPTENMVS